jgi:hypothetical protein
LARELLIARRNCGVQSERSNVAPVLVGVGVVLAVDDVAVGVVVVVAGGAGRGVLFVHAAASRRTARPIRTDGRAD